MTNRILCVTLSPIEHKEKRKSMMKKIILIALLTGTVFTLTAASEQQVYQCRKCRVQVVKDRRPSTGNCTATGSHTWDVLGTAGKNVYFCRKCRMLTATKHPPLRSYCSAQGAHIWDHLSVIGKDQYQCRKCSIRVLAEKCPKNTPCTSGGTHYWNKF